MRRLLTAVLLSAVALASAAAVPVSGPSDPLYDYDGDLGSVGPFTLTDQDGNTVTRDGLLGKVWVAHFFFTCCDQGCPMTSAHVKELQDRFRNYPDVMLVSFTVDPDDDRPDVLKRYAARFDADPERWRFLTGPRDAMYALIQEKFHQGVQRVPEEPASRRVIHSFNLVAVDHRGKIRGYVDGRDESEVRRLEDRVKRLAQAKYFPGINASLNGACAVLLVLGYVTVRSRRLTTHKVIMLTALAVSAIFLACYIYYHAHLQNWKSTRFPVDGWPRLTYLGILLSHTALAIVVAPLALFVTMQGLRGRLLSHVRLARWTLPLWLYVSVTGVIVYWMLYQLYPPA